MVSYRPAAGYERTRYDTNSLLVDERRIARARSNDLAQFRSAIVETEELQEGYAFRLGGEGKLIALIAELIVAERECCPFLALEVAALPNKGPLIVRVTGPAGTKEFVRSVFMKM